MYKRLLVFLLIFGLVACQDADIDIQEEIGRVQRDTRFLTDSPCAWTVLIDGTAYVPTFLPLSFRENGIEVFLKIEYLESSSTCQTSSNTDVSFPEIRIEQVRLVE